MEVILLEKMGKLGDIGDKANVKSGFGRNYLIPQGKAVFATEKNIAEFELRRADLEAQASEKLALSQSRADKLKEAIAAAGGDVTKNEISLPEGALRHLGEFTLDVQLHSDITETITVVIEAE